MLKPTHARSSAANQAKKEKKMPSSRLTEAPVQSQSAKGIFFSASLRRQ